MRTLKRPLVPSTVALLMLTLIAGTAAADHGSGHTTVPLPDQFLGGYVEAWQTSTYPDDVPHANMTMIAFGATTPERNVYMAYDMPREQLRASIAANAAQGKPTILSIAGEGDWHAPTNDRHVTTMAGDLIEIIEDHGFSGLDVNFEEGSAGFDEANASYTADMMRRVHDHFADQGQAFSLSIAPYGADPNGEANRAVTRTYQEIMRQNVDIIDFVGFQYYNTGFEVDSTWVRNVLDHWKSEIPGMTNDQWALGFLAGHDWGGYTTSYSTMVGIWRDLQDTHPGVRGVWTWGVDEKEASTGFGFFEAFESVIDTTAAAQPSGPFVDVFDGVHADSIERMAEAEVIAGYPDGTFRPAGHLTRGHLATLLARGLDLDASSCGPVCEEFPDIDGSVHEDAIQAVVGSEVASGYPDGTFRPERSITREQVASLMANAFDLPLNGDDHPFDDVSGSVHEEAIAATSAAEITSGRTPSMFAPSEPVRRDQMATFMDRALNGP